MESPYLTPQQAYALVALYEQGMSYHAASQVTGTPRSSAMTLYRRWRIHGTEVLKPRKQTYTPRPYAVKKAAVEAFLAGQTRGEVAREFNLSTTSQLGAWVRAYRDFGDAGLMPKPRQPRQPSAKEREGLPTEVETLQEELLYARAEVAYLKKLAALSNQKQQ